MTISKTLQLSLAKADIHIPVDTEPENLGRYIEAAERQRTETKRRVRLGLPIGNVRLSEWERVTLQRGPNKGKTAWKKGNRYFHGEKPPEGRGGKQEAGTKGKAATKPKADKVTPQAMVEKHKAIMAKGSTSHDDMQGFVDDLLTMTVKDINEVKKSLGLKASGKKAELAKKIGQKAFELVGKGKAAEGQWKQDSSKMSNNELGDYHDQLRERKRTEPDDNLRDEIDAEIQKVRELARRQTNQKVQKQIDSQTKTNKPESKPASKPTEKNIDTMSPGELYKYAKELGITPGKSKPQNMKLIKDHLGKNEGQ